jgi:YebC/PmpR family DNA-binding regulatory protein
MAGHSKWNNIKNRKGAVDAQRGKVFGQVAKLIRIAVKEGASADPKFNPGLRVVLDKARAANMPKEKIQKAVERGLGKSNSGASIQEIIYEGFGPAGVPLLIVAHTDNAVRTSAEMKFILSRNLGSLGSPGSAQYMFERKGEEFIPTMLMPAEGEQLQQVADLVAALRENEDVEEVFYAVELPDAE